MNTKTRYFVNCDDKGNWVGRGPYWRFDGREDLSLGVLVNPNGTEEVGVSLVIAEKNVKDGEWLEVTKEELDEKRTQYQNRNPSLRQ